jgi:ADP-ribose pyrophosphatase
VSVVQIRFMGVPTEVDAAITALRASDRVRLIDVSDRYPNRGSGQVRVYARALLVEPTSSDREYTHPVVLTVGVQQGWAEAETDPTRIDWPARQARAAIPFEAVNGRPVNPCEKTPVRYGRNQLGHWGEQRCADVLVTARTGGGYPVVLLVERADRRGWALPCGYVDQGESAEQAAVRELREETGLVLPDVVWSVDIPRYVPDPRGSDESWMVTTLARCDLGMVDQLPEVLGGDDAIRAQWILASSYREVERELDYGFSGRVCPAHRQLLAELLDGEVSR